MDFGSKQAAQKAGEAVQKRLEEKLGGKWELNVYQNLGWFFTCYLGTIAVSQYGEEAFSVLLAASDKHKGVGEVFWDYNNSVEVKYTYPTPEEAVIAHMNRARVFAKNLQEVIDSNIKQLTRWAPSRID